MEHLQKLALSLENQIKRERKQALSQEARVFEMDYMIFDEAQDLDLDSEKFAELWKKANPPLSEKAPELDGRYVLKEKNEEAN